MSHGMFRLFRETAPDPHRFDRLRNEAMPMLEKIAGFQRFAAIQTTDGRYGAFQVYDTREGLDEALRMLDKWRASSGHHHAADLQARGETGLSIVVQPVYDKGYGTVRIYRSDASLSEVSDIIEREGGEIIRHLPGMLRYTCVRFEDGRVATFTGCTTEAAAHQMTEAAQELRHKAGSQLGRVLPTEPEVIMGEMPFVFSKSAVLAHT